MLNTELSSSLRSFVKIDGSCSATAEEILKKCNSPQTNWLNDLKGGWALAISQEKKSMLATDRWGSRPLYYTVQNNKLISSENLDELFLLLPEPHFNKAALARFLLEDFSHPDETVVHEIKKVPPGTLVTFSDGILTQSKWANEPAWDPQNRDFQTTVKLWEEELVRHLTATLPLHQKWGVFVSGGLDSTGLVALCMDLIQKNNWHTQIELYNLTTDHPESNDQGFCKKLADHYQIPLFTHQGTPQELKNLFLKWKNIKSTLPFFPTLQMFEPLMQKAAQNQCTGLIFGYGADEQWTLPSQTLGLDFFAKRQWLLFFKTFHLADGVFSHFMEMLKLWARQSVPEIFKVLIHSFSSFGLPPHLPPSHAFKDQKNQLKKRIQACMNFFTSHAQKQLFLRNFVSGNNTYNLACHLTMAQAYGLKVYFPYLSPDMLDISLQTSSELFLCAQDKQVLRELLKDKLIDQIRTAPKFQDYSQLAYKTSLLLAEEDQNYLVKHQWVKPNQKPHFDDDFFFETLFADKLLKSAGAKSNDETSCTKKQNEKLRKTDH